MEKVSAVGPVCPPAPPPHVWETYEEISNEVTTTAKVSADKVSADKVFPTKSTKTTKKSRGRRMSLDEFLSENCCNKATKVLPEIQDNCSNTTSCPISVILGVNLIYTIARDTFESVTKGLEKQLDHTVKTITKMHPSFSVTTTTSPGVINQLVEIVIAHPRTNPEHDNGSDLYNMLRSMLAIHGFLAVLKEFRTSKLRVSLEMLSEALKFIEVKTGGRDHGQVEFDATEFFLFRPSYQRSDAIAALLCIGICIRVDPNRSKGEHRFVVIMKVCPHFIGRVQGVLGSRT